MRFSFSGKFSFSFLINYFLLFLGGVGFLRKIMKFEIYSGDFENWPRISQKNKNYGFKIKLWNWSRKKLKIAETDETKNRGKNTNYGFLKVSWNFTVVGQLSLVFKLHRIITKIILIKRCKIVWRFFLKFEEFSWGSQGYFFTRVALK